MAAVGGMLGIGGGAGGTGFNGPQGASQQEADTTYNQAANALSQQQGFVNGLMLQANPALAYQSGALQGYSNLANGIGPNPAQAQLAQATGQNVANQAALMAGQRGSNANVGLMARQAAQQGANTQQQSIGQAANLQAQQQLQGLQGMAGQANQIVGQAQQGLSNQVSGTQGLNANVLNSLSGQNAANASMANTRMAQQGQMLGGIMNGASSIMGMFGGAEGGVVPKQHYAQGNYIALDSKAQQTAPKAKAKQPSPQQSLQQPQQSDLYKGSSAFGSFLANSIASAFKPSQAAPKDNSEAELQSQLLQHGAYTGQTQQAPADNSEQPANPDVMNAAKGGKVPAMVAPGEIYLRPHQVQEVVKEGKDPMKIGEKIPGKAPVPGPVNSYANDVVRKDLDSGGIIVPNKQTKSKNPSEASIKFVHAIAAKHGMVATHKKDKKSK